MRLFKDGPEVPVDVDTRIASLCLPFRHTLLLKDVVYVPSMKRKLTFIHALDVITNLCLSTFSKCLF